MQSAVENVDDYLAEAPADRRSVLSLMRQSCLELLTGFQERMLYGMPAYLRDGVAEVAWASQKQHISLYVLRTDVLQAHRDRLAGLSLGKGCVRYRRPAQVDLDVVRAILAATAGTRGPVC